LAQIIYNIVLGIEEVSSGTYSASINRLPHVRYLKKDYNISGRTIKHQMKVFDVLDIRHVIVIATHILFVLKA